MVLTAAQTTAFFEAADQMGIPHATVIQLQVEGMTSLPDLADFDKDTLQQLTDNLRKPGGRVPDPNPGTAPGATIPTPHLYLEPSLNTVLQCAVSWSDFTIQLGMI